MARAAAPAKRVTRAPSRRKDNDGGAMPAAALSALDVLDEEDDPLVPEPDAPLEACEPEAVAVSLAWLARGPVVKPRDSRAMPFEIVPTVWQLDDAGVEAGAAGVTVSPTV
jgi:hypothetical protein